MLRAISGDDQAKLGVADYVWIDQKGEFHTKNRVIEVYEGVPRVERWIGLFPTPDEEVILSPCYYVPDPFRPQPCFIFLCEVRDTQDVAHPWNHRSMLRKLLNQGHPGPLVGFRQHYMLDIGRAASYQAADKQLGACVDAGIMLSSASFYEELNPWWFQVGPRPIGSDSQIENPQLALCDHLIIARYFLIKAGIELDVPVFLDEGVALVHPTNAEPEILADHLRTTGQDVHLRASGLEVKMPPNFDPYLVAVRLHMDTTQLEQKA